ncbi:MAG: DUF2339 domain-containing protein [Hyphomicrobiales bacterium]|nr:DUF2339 domain-containing protein [Hyphomicrobiales bacterium]
MLFLFMLVVAALVMGYLALRRADAALGKNAALEAELDRMRHLLAAMGQPSEAAHDRSASAPAPTRDDESAALQMPASDRIVGAAVPAEPVVPESPALTEAEPLRDDRSHLAAEARAQTPEIAGDLPPSPEAVPLASEPERSDAVIAASVTQIEPSIEATADDRGGDAERTFATKWTVWIGGIALAMGGLLIVRFSIEAGFFGPGVRLIMGAAFAAAMAIASEVMRRRDLRLDVRASFADQIPAVLAGVSVLSAFGVVYAAHAVYDMIGPGPAFALMGIIGLSALAASLLHGPRFGLFGLVGSYATPLMVSGTEPNYLALSVFIAIVTSAAFLLHLRRPSVALLGGAIAGHSLWTGLIAMGGDAPGWGDFLLVVAIVLATLLVESIDRLRARDAADAATDARSVWAHLAAFAAPLVLAGFVWVENGGDLAARLTLMVLVAGTILAGIRHRGLAPLAPLAGAAATGVILLWPGIDGPLRITAQLIFDLVRLDLVPSAAPGLVLFAIVLGAVVTVPLLASLLARWRNGDGDPLHRGCLAFASSLAPVCLMLATSLRLNGFNRTTAFAVLAAALALGAAALSELLYRQERTRAPDESDPLAFVGSAAYAAAGAIALGLAIAFALRETWLVVGFAVASGGVALVARRRPIPLLRSIAGALGTAALARVVWQPVWIDVGHLPVLNWLILAYGVPAAAFGVAAWALAGRRDRPLSLVEGLAAFFLTAFVGLEVVQAFVGDDLHGLWPLLRDLAFPFLADGDPARAAIRANLITAFIATLTVAMAALAALFMLVKHAARSAVLAAAENLVASITTVLALAGLGILLNPIFTGVPVSQPPFLNRLLLGYVVPAVLLAMLAIALPQRQGDRRLRSVLEALAIVLGVLGAVLVLRHWFTGPIMTVRTAATISFYESVSTTLLLLVLAAVVALWCGWRASAALRHGFVGLVVLTITYAAATLGDAKNPFLDGTRVEGPVLFNRILWGYAPVAAGFLALARMVGAPSGWTHRALLWAGAVTTYLMAFLLVRHGFHGATLYSWPPVTLAEAGIFGSLALTVAFLGSRLRGPRDTVTAARGRQLSLAQLAVATHLFMLFVAVRTGAGLVGWPVLNNSIAALLLPAALAGAMSVWCRLAGLQPLTARIYAIAAALGTLAYVLLQVRIVFHGLSLVSDVPVTLAEAGAFGTLALLAALVASRSLVRQQALRESQSLLSLWAGFAVGAPAVLLAVAGVYHAPLVGWPLFNNSLLGVLAPTALAAMLSLWSRGQVSALLVARIYGVGAVVGGLVFVLLQVRSALPPTEGFEELISGSHKTRLFGYSLAIIAYGVALLVTGFRMAYRDLRLAALAVVGLAVFKVFLLDLAGLEGLWRAASFIGLGASLIGIAYLYRWLEPEKAKSDRTEVAS